MDRRSTLGDLVLGSGTSVNYWLNLFTGKTWEEFVSHGSDVTGFPSSMKNLSTKVKVGDRFVCHVTQISRVISVLEVLSETFEDNQEIIWKGDRTFPIRFRVRPIVSLTFEESIPMVLFREKLKMFEGVTDQWSGLVRNSLRRIPREDGDVILEELQRQKLNPVVREFDPKKLFRDTSISTLVTEKGTIVTIPDDEKGTEETTPQIEVTSSVQQTESNDHTDIQYLLLRLGSEMGFNVWVARNDRNKEVNGKKLSDIPGLMSELPTISLDKNTKTIIENIDVLWFKKSQPVSGFEIESTTSVYSGLLRLSDLIRTVPHINTDLYIVYPDERRDKVLREVNRPTFKEGVSPTLSERVRMISFSDLRDGMKKGEGIGLRYLPPQWVSEELSESCEIES